VYGSLSRVCCVLSGRDLYVWPIGRSDECYRVCCFLGFDRETSVMKRPCPVKGSWATDEEGKSTVALCSVPYTATSFSITE
jgi:hypothetical protein